MTYYFDNAATAKYNPIVDDIIIDTITNTMKSYWKNPSSLYASNVKNEINKCRMNIAKFINAKSEEIIFTSGASESNNMAIRGWVDEIWMHTYKTPNIISTRIEHNSILSLLENSNLDATVTYCNVDDYGMVDYAALENLLLARKDKPILVTIHMANNEIGTIQDIAKISEIVHKYGGILHVDATQVLPYIPIDVEKFGIDLMSASGHKISSVLKGIGFLYKKDCINIQPLIYGSQENGLRGGTENTFYIMGLSKSIELCDNSNDRIKEMCDKRDYFINKLVEKFECKLNGHSTNRLPNNINVTFSQDVTGEAMLYTLDLSGIQISVGSACNSHSIEPSHVLKEIGLTNEQAMRTIRITLSKDVTYKDIDVVIAEIDKTIKIIEI